MVYSSVVFLFYFLPLLLLGYYLLPRLWAKNILLFIASILFYLWGAGNLIFLLLITGLLAWFFSWLIVTTKYKKGFLITSIIVFVGILVCTKYFGAIIDDLIYAGVRGLKPVKIITTIGVSFFIFQAISYNIDVYRKNDRFEKNFSFIMLYLTMLPQLISGPLVRYNVMEAQLKRRTFEFDRFTEGIRRFIIGMGKKVLIANQLSMLVGQIQNTDINLISPYIAWAGIMAFTLQLFFDFSGYTDMAIGVGKMLGFDLPENFNFPYISRSISEFWRRWHITLSGWLRDYIFTPLSLSFRYWGKTGVFMALMITFLICGIWHGTTWNFVIWGGMQGLFLGMEQLFLGKWLKRLKVFSVIYTLFVVMIGFIFIMTPNLKVALHYIKAMFFSGNIAPLGRNAFLTNEYITLFIIGALLSIPIILPDRFKTGSIGNIISVTKTVFLIAIFLLSIMTVVTETYNPFIYFRF